MLRLRARAHVQLLRADRDVSVGRDFPELECKLKTLSPRILFSTQVLGRARRRRPQGVGCRCDLETLETRLFGTFPLATPRIPYYALSVPKRGIRYGTDGIFD